MGFGPFGGGFGSAFSLFQVMFFLVFGVIIVMFVMNAVKYFRNASAPQESTFARIVSKRTEVRSSSNHHHHHDHVHMGSSSRTYYYITLEFDNGSRKEYLDVKGLYGLVVEGDSGYAAVKGDWIIAFQRQAGEQPGSGNGSGY
ncbi:DUF2500 domain-containing protein [Paenibacillus chungangensis]|uniref:DUF2500 domain-containing protein n=1 Tax=Paenibacillus chungangensis TaxID=696535 RepID=A0ABW3HQD8_9BACL